MIVIMVMVTTGDADGGDGDCGDDEDPTTS